MAVISTLLEPNIFGRPDEPVVIVQSPAGVKGHEEPQSRHLSPSLAMQNSHVPHQSLKQKYNQQLSPKIIFQPSPFPHELLWVSSCPVIYLLIISKKKIQKNKKRVFQLSSTTTKLVSSMLSSWSLLTWPEQQYAPASRFAIRKWLFTRWNALLTSMEVEFSVSEWPVHFSKSKACSSLTGCSVRVGPHGMLEAKDYQSKNEREYHYSRSFQDFSTEWQDSRRSRSLWRLNCYTRDWIVIYALPGGWVESMMNA